MKYKEELIRSMDYLAEDQRTIFLGQSVKFSGNAIYNTLESIDDSRKIETPPLPPQPAPVNITTAQAPVNEATGLTSTETALLSPGEQAIRLKQKGLA